VADLARSGVKPSAPSEPESVENGSTDIEIRFRVFRIVVSRDCRPADAGSRGRERTRALTPSQKLFFFLPTRPPQKERAADRAENITLKTREKEKGGRGGGEGGSYG
jgi:hypothetical protein